VILETEEPSPKAREKKTSRGPERSAKRLPTSSSSQKKGESPKERDTIWERRRSTAPGSNTSRKTCRPSKDKRHAHRSWGDRKERKGLERGRSSHRHEICSEKEASTLVFVQKKGFPKRVQKERQCRTEGCTEEASCRKKGIISKQPRKGTH